MLTKNVYILYPAGYSGNYLSWAINASDLDLCKTTVSSPVHLGNNTKYGGTGTSHLHYRIPTHQSFKIHLPWMILNKPNDFKIYVLNTDNANLTDTTTSILAYDSDPVFIVIHDDNNQDIKHYGQINCATKWPVYFSAMFASLGLELPFDPFSCTDDLNFRNLVAKEQAQLRTMSPLDDQIEKITSEFNNYINWYRARNAVNPHEINKDYYIERESFPDNCLFHLSCLDIASTNFVDILHKILSESQCLSDFDADKIIPVHQDYIAAQKNLQWFESIKTWRLTGKLDDYLNSHSVIQGMIIYHILKDCELIDKDPTTGDDPLGYMKWQAFYYRIKDSAWPVCDHEQDFYLLPKKIQTEIVKKFNYTPRFSTDVQRADCRKALADWKNLSLDDINTIYQSYKKNFSTLSNVS